VFFLDVSPSALPRFPGSAQLFEAQAGRGQSGDGISQAEETLQSVEAQLGELALQLQQELDRVAEIYNPNRPKTGGSQHPHNVCQHNCAPSGLAWCPSARGDG